MQSRMLVVPAIVAGLLFGGLAQAQDQNPLILKMVQELDALKAKVEPLEALQKDVASLRMQLREAKGSEPGMVSSDTKSAKKHDQLHLKYELAECPKGQYVAGIKTWGASVGGGKFDLVGLHVFCRLVIP